MKSLLTKLLIPILSGGVATAAAVGGYQSLHTEEGYRTIQVYDMQGEAIVDRPDVGAVPAYANMQLISGDSASTGLDSYLYLNLDNEEYALLEPESTMQLEANTDKDNSRTQIYLEKGALTNRLDQPLGENETYEVTTPNSTMAVRGTEFRVVVTIDADGISHTQLEVYDGVVEVTLIYPDGSTSEEPVSIPAGSSVRMWGDNTTSEYEYDTTGTTDTTSASATSETPVITETVYDVLTSDVIDFLIVSVDEGGHELTISIDELKELYGDALKIENADAASTTTAAKTSDTTNKTQTDSDTQSDKTSNAGTTGTSKTGTGTSNTTATTVTTASTAKTNTTATATSNDSSDDQSSSSSSDDSGSSSQSSGSGSSGGTTTYQNTVTSDSLNNADTTKVNFYYNGTLILQTDRPADGNVPQGPNMSATGSWVPNADGTTYTWVEAN